MGNVRQIMGDLWEVVAEMAGLYLQETPLVLLLAMLYIEDVDIALSVLSAI